MTTGGALLLGLVAYGLSLVLFIRAVSQVGTARAGAYFAIAPFVVPSSRSPWVSRRRGRSPGPGR